MAYLLGPIPYLLRAAEAAVGAEVELRLTAACSNRGLWPRPIKEEFERLEQRLGSLQVSRKGAVINQGRESLPGIGLLIPFLSHSLDEPLNCPEPAPGRSRPTTHRRCQSR